jgi:hypothetical protein
MSNPYDSQFGTIATALNLTSVAGVESKVETFRYDDPLFALSEPTLNSHALTVAYPIITVDGISSPTTNRSIEGFGTGGYDQFFNVF